MHDQKPGWCPKLPDMNFRCVPDDQLNRFGEGQSRKKKVVFFQAGYSVVLPSKCSWAASATAFVAWMVPSLCSGGA